MSGAGPALRRVNEESPWNWLHSYWLKLLLEVLTWALTLVLVDAEAKNVDTNSIAKMAVTKIFLEICFTSQHLW